MKILTLLISILVSSVVVHAQIDSASDPSTSGTFSQSQPTPTSDAFSMDQQTGTRSSVTSPGDTQLHFDSTIAPPEFVTSPLSTPPLTPTTDAFNQNIQGTDFLQAPSTATQNQIDPNSTSSATTTSPLDNRTLPQQDLPVQTVPVTPGESTTPGAQ